MTFDHNKTFAEAAKELFDQRRRDDELDARCRYMKGQRIKNSKRGYPAEWFATPLNGIPITTTAPEGDKTK